MGNKGTQHLSCKGLTCMQPWAKLADGQLVRSAVTLPGVLGLHRQGWGLDTWDLFRVLDGVAILAADTSGECRCGCSHSPGSQMHISCTSKQTWEELGMGRLIEGSDG